MQKSIKNFSEFPSFDGQFPSLNQFILELVEAHKNGKLASWDALEREVRRYYTPAIMEFIESMTPGWKKMASYSDGITLAHVTCVFLGMFMLPQFRSLTPEEQQIAKWIVLFHDIDKVHIAGKKDPMHAFNSAVVAANTLPKLGFPVTKTYPELIESWGGFTRSAFIQNRADDPPKPDNAKLPRILSEINLLFGENTPAAMIVQIILLHISLAVDKNYPTPSPLTEDEIRRFINLIALAPLKVMYLSDNEGWSLFDAEVRTQQKTDVLKSFERIQELVLGAG